MSLPLLGLCLFLAEMVLVGACLDFAGLAFEDEEPETAHPVTGKPMMWRRTSDGSYEWVERA